MQQIYPFTNGVIFKILFLKDDNEIIIYNDNIFSDSMEFYILYRHVGFNNIKSYEASLLEGGILPIYLQLGLNGSNFLFITISNSTLIKTIWS